MYSDLCLAFSTEGSKKYFKLDPQFPILLHRSGTRPTLDFLQAFLVDYSKCCLSNPTDRAVAMNGLASRISYILGCQHRYGVFGDFYFHRTLLWQRPDARKMSRIDYGNPGVVPSWSWMAYEGNIQFPDIPFECLDLFKDIEFKFGNKGALSTQAWRFEEGCHLEPEVAFDAATHRRILDSRGQERGWIMYDVEDGQDLRSERGVVVARSSPEVEGPGLYYMLVVRQKHFASRKYGRVGVGRIQYDYISRWRRGILVV